MTEAEKISHRDDPVVPRSGIAGAEQRLHVAAPPEVIDERAGEAPVSINAVVITVGELATLLRIDRKSVYNLVRTGEIPGVRRIGRAIRIHRPTVLNWLAQGQGRAPRSRSIR
jgi:excisionase family DNA binding protein